MYVINLPLIRNGSLIYHNQIYVVKYSKVYFILYFKIQIQFLFALISTEIDTTLSNLINVIKFHAITCN